MKYYKTLRKLKLMKCWKKSLHMQEQEEEKGFSKAFMPFSQSESKVFC